MFPDREAAAGKVQPHEQSTDGQARLLLSELQSVMAESRESCPGAGVAANLPDAESIGRTPQVAVSAMPVAALPADKGSSPWEARLVPAVVTLTADVQAQLPIIMLSEARQRVVLGRTQRGGCRINNKEVSGSHCTLTLQPKTGQLVLVDTSTNGTFVDGVRPSSSQKRTVELRNDQVVTLLPDLRADGSVAQDVPTFRVQLTRHEALRPSASSLASTGAEHENGASGRSTFWARRVALDARLERLTERCDSMPQ
jgi:hypothetical protein